MAVTIRVHLRGATIAGKLVLWRNAPTPPGMTVLADVVREADDSGGLLIRSEQTGALYCWDGKTVTYLPQSETKTALADLIPETSRWRPKPTREPIRSNVVTQGGSLGHRR